ncbi:serine hydrolase [Cryobacterium sp. BB736]|uniref:serine hydrolase domain-containing protein n=1 Tax=Cryobacterium sp. BB736 TaxID=2746963 RepID=UPI001873E0C7|nr:serine hydrolase domain-containing protein [Cryobacterium sp. BB736]
MRRFPLAAAALAASLAATGCVAHAAPATSPLEATVLDTLLRVVEESGAPGGLVLVRHGDEEFTLAAGDADLDGTELTTDMHFRIASNTKSMTCTVMLQQVDAGVIELDDELIEYVDRSEELRSFDERYDLSGITFRNLCQHTSGVGDYREALFSTILGDMSAPLERSELIEATLSAPRVGEPGQRFSYTNGGYVLLGLAIEAITDTPWAELYEEGINRPLGLTGTSYPAASETRLPEPFSHGYMAAFDDSLKPIPNSADDVTELSASIAYESGGVVSTIEDLGTWVEAVATGELLSDESFAAQWDTRATGVGKSYETAYGLGVQEYGPYRGHGGDMPGFVTQMLHNPETDTTIVVMLNNSDASGWFIELVGALIAAQVEPDAVPWTVDRIERQLFGSGG